MAWWAPILEKAYAKLNVNYANLNGGEMTQALRELTGMPAFKYKSADLSNDDVWDLIQRGEKEKWVMSA